jgi:hypothetical protein
LGLGYCAAFYVRWDKPDQENLASDCPATAGRYIFLTNGTAIPDNEERNDRMAMRKSVLKSPPARPELDRLLARARATGVTDDQLREQRVSFAYGNAPASSGITKETARNAANSILMRPPAR